MIAGAEPSDIRKFADQQGWGVGPRQIRHYVEAAEELFIEAAQTNREADLGRHVRQRRLLAARALNVGDYRAALLAASDEARLLGLYSHPGRPGKGGGPPAKAPLCCDERLRRYFVAFHKGDRREIEFIKRITPKSTYALSDLMLAEGMIHTLSLVHVTRQLESAAWVLSTTLAIQTSEEPRLELGLIWGVHAYLYKVRSDGWNSFTDKLGINGDSLVRNNYLGNFLALQGQQVYDQAPTVEELQAEFAACDMKAPRLLTADECTEEYYAAMRPFIRA